MGETKNLSAPLEDYLEAIAVLIETRGSARARDIAAELHVHKSSVTAALQSLARKGLIHYVPYQAATLTRNGRARAAEIIRRHESIKRFLTDVLLVSEALAEENACRLEHTLDEEVLRRMGQFVSFVEKRAAAGRTACSAAFAAFCQEKAEQ